MRKTKVIFYNNGNRVYMDNVYDEIRHSTGSCDVLGRPIYEGDFIMSVQRSKKYWEYSDDYYMEDGVLIVSGQVALLGSMGWVIKKPEYEYVKLDEESFEHHPSAKYYKLRFKNRHFIKYTNV